MGLETFKDERTRGSETHLSVGWPVLQTGGHSSSSLRHLLNVLKRNSESEKFKDSLSTAPSLSSILLLSTYATFLIKCYLSFMSYVIVSKHLFSREATVEFEVGFSRALEEGTRSGSRVWCKRPHLGPVFSPVSISFQKIMMTVHVFF